CAPPARNRVAPSQAAPAGDPPQPPAETSAVYSLRHRHRPWVAHQKLIAISFLGDAAVVFLAMVIAYVLRFETSLKELGISHPGLEVRNYFSHLLLGGVLMLGLLANFRIHDPRNFLALRPTFTVIFKSCAIWFVGFLGLALIFKLSPAISRIYCAVGAVLALVMLSAWRWVLYCILRRENFARVLRQKAVFVGWNSECDNAIKRFGDGRSHRMSIHGVIAPPGGAFEHQPPAEVPVLGDYDNFRNLIRTSGADVVMAVDGCMDRHRMLMLAETCGKEFVDFKLVPSCFQILVSGLQVESIHGMPVLGVGKLPLHHAFNNALKRSVDILGALLGLLVFGPAILIFALMVWMESRGPVFYRQRRIGLNGRPFDILKIRSMRLDAEKAGAPGWTVKDDPRRLKIGAFMREWNIDELPQFLNVLRGEMSLVGPRPERPELIAGFNEEIPHYNVRHNIKPGITGWAQVNGLRGDTCLRERVKFDLDYIENWNFLLDFQIMFMTFLNRRGAC
ncbi:MAG: exopolysaccharide biosynthesis polyprenyl glycosylphosphotransferase, partial [Akkermansiaceae bacterium]|nr:exopolysaccharide biosynthesis polyprenyl glycosylphosphotransferase [Akkermansiaceae bacterium]